MDTPIDSPPYDRLASRRGLRDRLGDTSLRWISGLAAFGVIALIALIIYEVIHQARPSIQTFGISFIWHETWNAVSDQYGALDFLVATLYVTGLAVLLAAPVAIAIGLYLSELAPGGVRGVVGSLVEMLAAIPSVVLGLWGILVLGPVVHNQFGPWLNDVLGWTPFFATKPISGSTMFTAVLILTIMIVPITAAISRDLFLQVPPDIKEGAIGLGLTRWEMVRGVMLPYTRGGLISAVLLGAGPCARRGDCRHAGDRDDRTSHRQPLRDGRHACEPDRGAVSGRGVQSPSRLALLSRRDPAGDLADRELRRAVDRAPLRHRTEGVRWKLPLPPPSP